MRQLIFLLFLFPLIAVGQQSPTQILNTPWQKINYKLEVGQRLLLPADTLSYPPGATVRDTTRLLAFAPNGNLYKLWNGVWSLIGAGGGTDVQLLSDTAIVVGDDTVRIKPITFESDMPPAYFFKDGDTIRDYTLQYLNDSVKIRKSGDTLFFPNGDSIYAAGIDRTGFLTADSQYIDGPKIFTQNLQVGSWALGNRDLKFFMYSNIFSPGESNSTYGFIRGRDLGSNSGSVFFNGHGGSNGFGALGGSNVNIASLTWSDKGVRIKEESDFLADSASLIIEGTDAIRIPVGTTAQRPIALLPGYMRVNTDSSGIEWYNGSAWRVLGSGGGGSGTVTTGYGINGDGSGGSPLVWDSSEARAQIARVARDSVEFNLVALNSGSSGQRLLWSSGDSLFIKRPVEGTNISFISNPDSSLTWNVSAPSQRLIFGTGSASATSPSLLYDSTAKSLWSLASGLGLSATPYYPLRLQRTETTAGTWGLNFNLQTDATGVIRKTEIGATGTSATLDFTATSRIRSLSTHWMEGSFKVSDAFGVRSTGDLLLVPSESASIDATPNSVHIISDGNTVADRTQPVFIFDAEGRARIGEGPATQRNFAAALDVSSTRAGFLPPRMTQGQIDSMGGIMAIYVTSGGSGYDGTSTLTITGGGGTGAAGLLSVASGAVTRVTITNYGLGYTSAPTVGTAGPGSGAVFSLQFQTVPAGTVVYNTTTNKLQCYDGTTWNNLF